MVELAGLRQRNRVSVKNLWFSRRDVTCNVSTRDPGRNPVSGLVVGKSRLGHDLPIQDSQLGSDQSLFKICLVSGVERQEQEWSVG
ncbi:hypothetical protein [Microseira wollei]|uniref:hypothetical protein n=1 Tax=Microseira wollei TaxID=467598 RepID=UPI001CFE0250|nr:hypothetical protein [Microseira wollei]